MQSILIIGGGNMGAALATRWRDAFDIDLTIAETSVERRAALKAQGLHAPDELEIPEEGFSVIVLAVKPQAFAELKPQLGGIVGEATVISIMAGVPLASLQELTAHAARVMPNTPAMIGEGISAICAPALEADRLELVKSLFNETGHTVIITDERQMHAVTAISGSGPAYLFTFMEGLEAAARAQGLDATTARALVVQTMRGAALLADQEGGDAARLRQQVTSPGGTTQAALEHFDQGQLHTMIARAVTAAAERSEALAST